MHLHGICYQNYPKIQFRYPFFWANLYVLVITLKASHAHKHKHIYVSITLYMHVY